MKFRFDLRDKAAFYWSYFHCKVFGLWLEVKRPKLRMFLYEMLYSSAKLFRKDSLLPSPFHVDDVETVFGKFRVRPGTVDMSIASPAFERNDVDRLLGLIEGLRCKGKRVLFLDIGADLGTFTVTVGNRFKRSRLVKVMAFEPAHSSFGLLGENVRLNGLEDIAELHNFALFNEDGVELDFSFNQSAPGSSGLKPGAEGAVRVKARTLDAVLRDRLGDFDAIVFKMDVEGAERQVLEGSRAVLRSGREIYLMVEDFVEPSIISYLEGMGAEFEAKLTPYNSWWRYARQRGDP